MDILSLLDDAESWEAFLAHKIEGGHMNKQELQEWETFIAAKAYISPAQAVHQGLSFPHPVKKQISKMGTDKKRAVYTYPDAENRLLKLFTWLLSREFDQLFAPNLYSFRQGSGVRNAIHSIIHTKNIGAFYCYKVDIHDYFNSIPVEKLLPPLKTALKSQPRAYAFLEALLTDPWAMENEKEVQPQKGIMAGTPISTFLANFYLSAIDWDFYNQGILYARYSDDMILFAPTEEELQKNIVYLKTQLNACGLTINPKKEAYSAPGQPWTFLGISYENGIIDVSPISAEKLKAKMRRKTRALQRWQARKGATGVQAAKAFVRIFNKKLFDNPASNELTWTHWYFPIINTDKTLKAVDNYCQQCIRTLATGKHTKAAYNFRYEQIKELGYRNLVHAYYESIPKDQ